ncbi:P-type conjugative transfer protein TrbL [Marinifilum sp. JC120]|nr:P-type conjugative transfer protein TrbL [Marinifilum sp. JC120]
MPILPCYFSFFLELPEKPQASSWHHLYRRIVSELLLLFAFVGRYLSALFPLCRHCKQHLQNKESKHSGKPIIFAYNLQSLFWIKLEIRRPNVNAVICFIVALSLCCIVPSECFADSASAMNLGFADDLLANFETTAKTWESAIRGYSLTLFKVLITIELAWLGTQSILKQYDMKQKLAELVLLIIYASFMASIVFHSGEWTTALIKSFSSVALKTGAPEATPSAIFAYGYDIICTLTDEMSLLESVGVILCCVIIAITFALMTAQVLLVKCESIIVLNAGAILLGFGGSKFTKDYAINYLKYSLAVAAKLFTLQLLMGMSMNFIETFTTLNSKSFTDIILVVCSSVLILALIKFIPAKVAEIVNVSQVSGGGALTSAMSAIGITTMTAMQMPAQALGGAIEAKRGMDTLKEAFNMAGSQGATGLGKGMQALKNLGGAARDNIGATNMGNLRSTITSHHEAFKMQQPAGPSTNFQLP